MRRLPGALPYVDLQCTRVLLPAALRKAALQVRDRCQRGIPFAQAILGVGFPVQRRVGLRAVERGEFREFRLRLVVAVFVEILAPVVVQLRHAISLFLLALALFLFAVSFLLLPIALFLFTITRLLLAVAFFLILILLLILVVLRAFLLVLRRHLERAGEDSGHGGDGPLCSHAAGQCQQCGQREKHRAAKNRRLTGNQRRSLAHFSLLHLYNAHVLFLSSFGDPFCFTTGAGDSARCCNSSPTTRTLNKIPRESMRSRMFSSCAGVTSRGLWATSSSTRSSSSSTLTRPVSPCSSAVCRYKRFSSSKSSARWRSEEMFTSFCFAFAGPAFPSSTRTISERPRCSPTAMIKTRSRTLLASATPGSGVTRFVTRPARNATITTAAMAPTAAHRRGGSHPAVKPPPKLHQRARRSGSRGAICCQTRCP